MLPVRRDHRSRLTAQKDLFLSLLGRALAEELGDIEIYEVCVMKDDRLDRALHLVALVTVRGNDVHHIAGNPVLVGECDAAEGVAHLLPELSLNHFAGGVFVVLERFAYVGEQRAGDEMIVLDGDATAKRVFKHIGDGDALPRTGIEVLNESHVYVAGKQGELDGAQFVEGPALAAAPRGDRF